MAGLDMVVVYAKGTDGEPQYKARLWRVGDGQGPVPTGHSWCATSLPLMRAMIPFMSSCDYNIGRRPEDEPHIVEVWV